MVFDEIKSHFFQGGCSLSCLNGNNDSHVKSLEIHREEAVLELRAEVSSCFANVKLGNVTGF